MNRIAFIFPGQGAQYVGMGKSLCENFDLANKIFEEADNILGFGLRKLCLEGSLEELTKTENTQPAVFVTGYAAYKVYMEEVGMQPFCCAGHSLGEITALACADAIRFSDAVNIVRERGRLMQEASAIGSGSMAAISGIDKLTIARECEKISRPEELVVISNYNSPMQIVISGHRHAVEAVSDHLKELGARVTPLKVSAPFHSPIMAPAAQGLSDVLKKYQYKEPKYTVFSNVNAKPYAGVHEIIELLTEQMVKPVQWQKIMKGFKQEGIKTAIELGPKNILKKLMTQNVHTMQVFSCEKERDIVDLKNFFHITEKEEIENDSNITVVTKCLAIAVCTKNHNIDQGAYEQGVVIPYNSIKKMQENIEKEKREPRRKEMEAALNMLKGVFAAKGTSQKEQNIRFKQICDQTKARELIHELGLL